MDLLDRIDLGGNRRPIEDAEERQKRERQLKEFKEKLPAVRKGQEESSILLPPPKRPDGSVVTLDPKTGKNKPRPAISQKTFNPVDEIKGAIKGALGPLDQGLNDFVDTAAESLLGRSKEESQRMRQEGKQKFVATDKALKEDPVADIVRVPLGAGTRAVEGVLDTAALGFDYTMQNFGINKDPKRNPYDLDRYERAVFDTGFSKPVTEIGQGLQNMAAFAVGMSKVAGGLKAAGAGGALTLGTGKLTGTGFATKVAKATAPGLVPGAVADFLLASDGNLSNLMRDWAPDSVKDLFFLAINDEDGPWVSRAKAVAEGMPAGVLIDSIRLMVRGVTRSRFWKSKGKTNQEAVALALDEVNQLKLEFDDAYNKGVTAESERWAQSQSNRMQEYLTRERDLTERIQQREELEKSLQQLTIPGVEAPPKGVDEDFLNLGKQVELDGTVDIRDPERIDAIRNDNRFTVEELPDGDGVRITGMTDEGWNQLNEPSTAGRVDESSELSALRQELEQVQNLQNRLDDEIVRGFNPDSANLEPWERSADVRPTEPNQEIARQLRTTDIGSVPPPKDAPLYKGGDGLITDAQWRLLGVEGEPLRLLKGIEQRVDLQEIARGSRMSDAEVYKRSAEVLKNTLEAFTLSPDISIQEAISGAGGTRVDGVLNRQGVLAMRAMLQQGAEQIHQLSILSKVNTAAGRTNANDMDKILDRVVGIIEMMKLAQADYGGGLRVFGMPLDRAGEGGGFTAKLFQRKDLNDLSATEARKWAQRVSDLYRSGDPKAQENLNQLVDAMVLSGGDVTSQVGFFRLAAQLEGKQLMQGFYNSLFSGPATSQAIGLTNFVTGTIRPAGLALGSVFRGDMDAARASLAGYAVLRDALKPALKVFKTSFMTGDSITGNARTTEFKASSQATIEALRITAQGNPGKEMAVKFLDWQLNVMHNPIMSFPTRTITAVDSMHKYMMARSDIQIESWTQALREARTSGEDPSALVQRYLNINSKKIDPASGRVLDPELANMVDDAAMQGDPGAMVNAFSKLIDSIPGGRLVVPVIRSMGELQKYAAYATPGVSEYMRRHTGLYQKVKTGVASAAEIRLFDEYRGREAIGAMIFASGAMAALNGRMTGQGPVDRDRRAIWLKENQPLSFNFGTPEKPVWWSYARIEPLATMLPVMADLVDASKYALDTGRADQLASQLVFSIAKSMLDKSALVGLSSIAEILDPDNISNPDFVQKNLLNTANNFVPFSSARRALSRAISGEMREVNNELERLMTTAAPFIANAFPPKIDRMTGKPVLHESGGWWNAMSAIKVAGPDVPEGTKFLNRISFKMNDEVRLGADMVELDAKQRNYVDMKMYEWGLPKEIERLSKRSWVQQELKEYEAGAKAQKIEALNSYKEVQSIMSKARRYGLDQLMQTDKTYEAKVTEARMTKQDYRRGVFNRTSEDYLNLQQAPK